MPFHQWWQFALGGFAIGIGFSFAVILVAAALNKGIKDSTSPFGSS